MKTQQKMRTNRQSLIDEKSDWNGPMFPFKGTADLYNMPCMTDTTNFEDTEWEEEQQACSKINIKNGLGALISAYDTFSEDSDCEKSLPLEVGTRSESAKEMSQSNFKKHDSDDEMPLHKPIGKFPTVESDENKTLCAVNDKFPSSIQNKKKRKRTYKRKTKTVKEEKKLAENKSHRTNKMFVKRKTTLLERLLENEIRHERNVLLQCVRYVVKNNCFNL